MVHLCWRVQAGQDLYPSWRHYPHVTNFFGPLYFVLVGGLGQLTDADLPQLFHLGRLASLGASLLTSLSLIIVAWRYAGVLPAITAGILCVSAGPAIRFSLMTRPDLFAEMLGFLGFLLATAGSAGRHRIIGALLLALAILSKQSAVAFLVAAVLSLWIERQRRQAATVLLACLGPLAVVVATVTGLITPRFLPDLFGGGAHALVADSLERAGDPGSRLLAGPVVAFAAWHLLLVSGQPALLPAGSVRPGHCVGQFRFRSEAGG